MMSKHDQGVFQHSHIFCCQADSTPEPGMCYLLKGLHFIGFALYVGAKFPTFN